MHSSPLSASRDHRNLRILHLEDSDVDARLIKGILNRSLANCVIHREYTEKAFEAALRAGSVDLILADYSLPSFDGASALALARQHLPDVPFIFVSGAIGESQAIESLHAGATDYILKDNLKRLVPAVQRALEEAHEKALRRQAEASQLQLATAIEQAGEAMMITDVHGVISYVNPAFENITGFAAAEVIGRTPALLKSGVHDAGFYAGMWSDITTGQTWRGRFINKRKNGDLYHEDSVISPIRDASGDIINFVAVKHDISREVELEEQLRHSQKMEALGIMAGGVAHDFNNLLAVILAHAELIARDVGDDEECMDSVKEVVEAAEHGKSLINQLMTISKRQPVTIRRVDLNALIERMLKMLRPLLGNGIDIETSLQPDCSAIEADPAQIEQVIINLGVNARDAMSGAGRLRIRTTHENFESSVVLRHAEVAPGKYVRVDVGDSGTGIPADIIEHIFDPFFTTKEEGKGTGLGLAAAYGIVQKFDGFINVRSAVGSGTVFSIFFPAVSAEAGTPPATDDAAIEAAESQPTTILLVEDEPDLLQVIGNQLQAQGFRVYRAATGSEATTLFINHANSIDLLLTDVILPDFNGKVLAERLRRKCPTLRVIFITAGDMERQVADDIERHESQVLLFKPFTVQDLTQNILKSLDL